MLKTSRSLPSASLTRIYLKDSPFKELACGARTVWRQGKKCTSSQAESHMVYQRVTPPAIAVEAKELLRAQPKNSSIGRAEQPQVSEQYDPFGIGRAVSRATEGTPWWHSAIAKSVNWAVLLAALLPFLLAVLSAVVVAGAAASSIEAPSWLKASSWAFLLWVGLFVGDRTVGDWVRQLLFDRSSLSMRPTAARPGQRGSVIVIGAGPVGLATVKECLAEGLAVQCFDRQSGVGGVFRFNRDFAGGCWPTVRLTTSP